MSTLAADGLKQPYLQHALCSAEMIIQKDLKLERNLCLRDAASELYGVIFGVSRSLETCCQQRKPHAEIRHCRDDWCLSFVDERIVMGSEEALVGAQVCKEGADLGDSCKLINVFGSPAKHDSIEPGARKTLLVYVSHFSASLALIIFLFFQYPSSWIPSCWRNLDNQVQKCMFDPCL